MSIRKVGLVVLWFLQASAILFAQAEIRVRELGIQVGVLETGEHNAITDVKGVLVGHHTLIQGDHVRTGVTAILPHSGNLFQNKVPAAMFIGNGFGKLTGISQVQELGNIETPIVLTNTLSVPTAARALTVYTLSQPGNEMVKSVNPVVGETNDGRLNDIRGFHVKEEHVFAAIKAASAGPVTEGSVGAGTGTICFGFKGGIGTSSRMLPGNQGGYTVGVLVQTNFGGNLTVAGVPVHREWRKMRQKNTPPKDGSCMIVVATDAPLTSRNLERLAKRAMLGLARTGGIASNGSGDYVIAFSTAEELRIPHSSESTFLANRELRNDRLTPLFRAVIEATEEAILNSLFVATTIDEVEALPVDEVLSILKEHKAVHRH